MSIPALRRPEPANEHKANPGGEMPGPREGVGASEPAAMDALGRLEHSRTQLLNDAAGPRAKSRRRPRARWSAGGPAMRGRRNRSPRRPSPRQVKLAPALWPPFARRLSKSALGLALLAALAYEPLQNYFQTSSVEAIVTRARVHAALADRGSGQRAPGPRGCGNVEYGRSLPDPDRRPERGSGAGAGSRGGP